MTDVLKSFDVVNISNGLASLLINVGVILGMDYRDYQHFITSLLERKKKEVIKEKKKNFKECSI